MACDKKIGLTHMKKYRPCYAHSNKKVRAVILLLASLGIRVGAIYAIKPKRLKRVESHDLYRLLI